MAISLVGTDTASSSTVTIPSGHQQGDLLVIFGFRNDTTSITLPAGWTNHNSGTSGSDRSYRVGWKIATSASETSGTWTNALHLHCAVYRGASDTNPLRGTGGSNSGAGPTVNYVGLAAFNYLASATSWQFAVAGYTSAASTLETPPATMVNRTNLVGATFESAFHDTNGSTTPWAASSVGVGAAGNYLTLVVQIIPARTALNNYRYVRVGDGMGTGERVK